MTTLTEAERLADALELYGPLEPVAITKHKAAAELRRLVSFNKDLMDEVARLNKAVADEREACAKVCEEMYRRDGFAAVECEAADECAAAIRARGNT